MIIITVMPDFVSVLEIKMADLSACAALLAELNKIILSFLYSVFTSVSSQRQSFC